MPRPSNIEPRGAVTGAPRPPAGEGPSSPRPGRRRLLGAAAGWARPRPRRAGADAGLGTEGRCAPVPGLGERLRQGAARGAVTSPQGQVAGAWGAGRASAARSCRGWGAGRALAGSRSCGPGSAPLHPWTSGRGRSASPPAEPDGGLVAPPRGRRRELPSRCLPPGAVAAGPGAGAAQSPPRDVQSGSAASLVPALRRCPCECTAPPAGGTATSPNPRRPGGRSEPANGAPHAPPTAGGWCVPRTRDRKQGTCHAVAQAATASRSQV